MKIEVKQGYLSQDVRWGDVNGDMLDDFICLNDDGIPNISLNHGGDPPTFEFVGAIREEKTTQSEVRLADIDGGGRVDYCIVERDGVSCWCNAGTGKATTAEHGGRWETMVTGDDQKIIDLDPCLGSLGTRFTDIIGDGRADALYMHSDVHTDIHINQRGDRSDGTGLKPYWRRFSSQIEGWPHDRTVTREHMLFGRIFGTGRSDVVHMEPVGEDHDYIFHSTVTQALEDNRFEATVQGIAIHLVEAAMSKYIMSHHVLVLTSIATFGCPLMERWTSSRKAKPTNCFS